jgi:outer membrane lipoprotein-sorting protein
VRVPVAALLALATTLGAAPGWWSSFTRMPSLESRFRQESDSAVFGKLSREGHLVLARGGRLKVAYAGGFTVTCDGKQLVQYDPDTRTAQKVDLARALRDFPLLGILLDPQRLEGLYKLQAIGGDSLKLLPREAGLPELKATGRKGFLHSLEWTDPTGARQKLQLLDAKTPAQLRPGSFAAQLPPGTRWSTPNG